MENIQQWKVGDVLSASKLNAMVDAINDLLAGQTGNSDVYITRDELNDILKQYSDIGHTHSVNEIVDLVLPTKLSQLQNDTLYVTEDYVTNAIANAQLGGDGEVDLSAYATKNYVDSEIDKIELTPGPQGEQGPKGETGEQGPKGDDGYTPIKGVDYFTTADKEEMLSGYATEKFVSDSIANAQLGGDGNVDLSNYATKEHVHNLNELDGKIKDSQAEFMIPSSNMINPEECVSGFVSGLNGAEYTHATMCRTGYIEVDATKRYFIDATKINSGHSCVYNKNKVFINKITLSSNEIILPEDTKYIRFTIIDKEYVGLIQFNEGEYLLPYEPYGYKFKNSIKVPKINLPAKLYALVDEEFNIYFDNILEYDYKDYHIRVICNEGSQLDRCYRLTPTTSGEIDITIQLYDKYESFITQKTSKVIKSTKTQGDGVTKSVLILGDSTTASGIAVSKLIKNFEDDSMNITMLGTIGDSNVKHEGRSGWSYTTYYNKESLANNINAFYNPDTSLFDYSYYCNNTNTPVPDYFILNLGINDVYSYSDDANLTAKLLIIKKQIDHIVSSIQQFDNNVKVCIALPIPPNYSQNGFYDQDQTRNRCKRNNALLVDELIKTYDNRESERIYLIPLHCNLDTEYNFKLIDEVVNKRSTITYKASAKGSNVHPDESGYWQCADSYWFFLKSLN